MFYSINNSYWQGTTIYTLSYNDQELNNRKSGFIYWLSKLTLLYLCYAVIYPTTTFADQINIDITGLSYRIGANKNNPAYTDAPRRLDKNGVFVFNPGVGFGWDFRPIQKQNGFSFITKAIYFRDCDDRGFFMLGGGTRYRYFFNKYLSGDINAMTMLSAGQQWRTSTYNYAILPLILLGVNYHLKNDMILGMNFTVTPKNSSFDATGGFWILFGTLQLSFPILI